MTRTTNYKVVEQTETRVVIRDLGPWTNFMTVTNAVEDVVAELAFDGELKPGQRLFYYDSDGALDEIMVEWNAFGARFGGFAPGRPQ
jgi:hypothetical protein